MMLAGKDFVLWNSATSSFGSGRAQFRSLKEANAFIEAPVVKEYTDLVDALTRMYGRIGMHEVCRKCFAGEKRGPGDINREPRVGVGCCKPCGLQGHEGCLSKPLGCAIWFCDYTSDRFRDTYEFVHAIRAVLIVKALGYGYGFFNERRPKTLDSKQRHLLRVARWAIEAWAA